MGFKKIISFKKVIKTLLLVSLTALFSFNNKPESFKASQIKYPKVKAAYAKKWDSLQKDLKEKGITAANFEVHLRNFKYEKQLELWARNKGDKEYRLVKTFKVCATSGGLGPKRKEGDGQVPEGFYEVSWFNPMSDYHLGLKVNYPNSSDHIKSKGSRPGGDIMIHGNCVTIGCIPIENEPIEELYVACVEAKNNSNTITLEMYPCRLTNENWASLSKQATAENLKFWGTLKPVYLYFEEHHQMPVIKVNKEGDYQLAN
ncbi:MAG: L,D-transpeptidase family protein [Bacteroidia bacterium]